MERARRVLIWGLGGLWILDGLLQLQPAMFTSALVQGVWAPVAQGNPAWLQALIRWAIGLTAGWLPLFNGLIAAVQLAIGALLLMGILTGRRRLSAAGLGASLLFAVTVWVFGEGMGGVLAPGASFLNGAPGSALVYALGSAVALLGERGWRRVEGWLGIDPLQAVLVLLLLVGAAWQLAGPFWTPVGLSAPVASNVTMPQPHLVAVLVNLGAKAAAAAPLVVNLALILVLTAAGVGVVFAPGSRGLLAAWLATLFVLWVVAQDAGMLFSGTATDPNTLPVLAVLLLACHSGHRAAAAPRTDASPRLRGFRQRTA